MSVACSPCFEQIDVKSVVEHAWKLIDNKNNKLPLYENYKLIKPNFCSETSKYRGEILEIFKGISGSAIESLNGIELGCGGDVLVAEVIAIDYDFPYTKCGDSPLHLKGDCRTLPWFADNALDYLYSSHLFEDFSQSENFDVLAEWIRVLKPAGYMLLLLPDQQRYECHCARKGDVPNEHHQIPEFGPEYLASLVEQKSGLELVTIIRFWERQGNADDYNFLAVMQKNPK